MFANLKDYYDFLDKDISLKKNFELSTQLSTLRDKIDNDDEKKKCSFEILFNDLIFRKGEYIPLFSNNNEVYPSLSLFEDFEYIKSRSLCNNPKYKAKYNHLLWVSPNNKRINYAKLAIDNYLIFITNINLSSKDNISNKGFSEMFMNLFYLSQVINYKKSDIINLLVSHLNKDKLNGLHKYMLMEYISKEGKKIKNEILKTFFTYSNHTINKNTYPEFTKEFLKLLILLSNKLDLSAKEFHNKLGDFYIENSKKHKGSFIIHHYYFDALKEFQKANDKNKIEKTTLLIEKAKDELNFSKTNNNISNPIFQIWLDKLKNELTNKIEKTDSKNIFEHLILSKNIFPEAENLTENSNPIFDLVSITNFDINKNITNNKNSFSLYHMFIYSFSIRHLWFVFYLGFKKGKINFKTLKHYLENNTWYGETITSIDPTGEKEYFKWTELLLPSIENFYLQTEIDIKTQTNSNYILSIDALSIKFEGVLREFSRRIGAQTIDFRDNETQERISFDKMLANDKLTKIIRKDDIAFFKYLFTKEGMNLRNNIAHSFYKPKDYSVSIMWLLITAFLKLGDYKIKIDSA